MLIVYSIVGFLLAIAILVTVHEFGHFWVARRLGVKVLRFSIGFGKPLITWHGKDGVEYVIAVFPLGGYVQMLDESEGDVAEEEKHLAFNRKPISTRIAVVVAGPLFNILFAILAYWLMFVLGIRALAPIIGDVAPNSIAAVAGLKSQQEILAIDQNLTPSWRAVNLALMSHLGEKNQITFKVQNINSQKITSKQLNLKQWQVDERTPNVIASLGITPYLPAAPAVIGKILPNHPAHKAGLKAGDKILTADKKAIKDWNSFVTYIRVRPHKQTQITVARQGKNVSITLTPQSIQGKDGKTYGFIGVQSKPVKWPNNLIRTQRYSVLHAWWPAVKTTLHIVKLTFIVLGKMVTGKISFHSISGPIGIAQGAGISASIGLAYYLSFLAIISISLGVLNILPIPMLDGGHLIYYLYELIIGRPVSGKTRLLGFKMGMLMLLCLMVLAFYNDIARLIG